MRKKIDRAAVVTAFDKLGTGRAVARELDIHENTVCAILREVRGHCVRCGKPAVLGKKSCADCLAFDRDRIKEARRVRARAGFCIECEKPRVPFSRLYCESHRLAAIDRNAAYEARRFASRGSPNKGVPITRQRLRSLRNRYGEGAVECWDDAGGACEICGRRYEDVSMNIHHRDEDQTNNARSNFACLCYSCHQTTHLILENGARRSFVAWFEAAYPDKPLR